MTEPTPGIRSDTAADPGRPGRRSWVITGRKWYSSKPRSSTPDRHGGDATPRRPRTGGVDVHRASRCPGVDIAVTCRRWPIRCVVRQVRWSLRGLLPGRTGPADALLGERGRRLRDRATPAGPGRIHHCTRWLGVAPRIRHARERATDRRSGVVVKDKQTIQNRIADSAAETRPPTDELARGLEDRHAGQQRGTLGRLDDQVLGARVLHDVIDRAIEAHCGPATDGPRRWRKMQTATRALGADRRRCRTRSIGNQWRAES